MKLNSKQNAQRELIEQKTGAIETLHPVWSGAVSICGGLFGFAAGQLIRNHQQTDEQKMMMMTGCWTWDNCLYLSLSMTGKL